MPVWEALEWASVLHSVGAVGTGATGLKVKEANHFPLVAWFRSPSNEQLSFPATAAIPFFFSAYVPNGVFFPAGTQLLAKHICGHPLISRIRKVMREGGIC